MCRARDRTLTSTLSGIETRSFHGFSHRITDILRDRQPRPVGGWKHLLGRTFHGRPRPPATSLSGCKELFGVHSCARLAAHAQHRSVGAVPPAAVAPAPAAPAPAAPAPAARVAVNLVCIQVTSPSSRMMMGGATRRIMHQIGTASSRRTRRRQRPPRWTRPKWWSTPTSGCRHWMRRGQWVRSRTHFTSRRRKSS